MDVRMPQLLDPKRPAQVPPDAQDHEIDPELKMIVFTDTVKGGPSPGTWVWAVGLTQTGGWNVVYPPVLNTALSPVGDAVPLPGEGNGHDEFPNGAEWSRAQGQNSRVYWSAYTQGPHGPAAIQFNEFDPATGFAVRPTPLTFSTHVGDHRFLTNCSYSPNNLVDRVLLYVREPPSRRPGAGRGGWTVDRGQYLPAEDNNFINAFVPTGARSGTIRPVPDAYAVIMAQQLAGSRNVEIVWQDLLLGGVQPPPVVIHRYPDFVAQGLDVLGVGARRVPSLDNLTRRSYVMYAVLKAADGSTWYDSFLLHWHIGNLPGMGRIDDPGRILATPANMEVAYGRRMIPDPAVLGTHTHITDDENFDGVDGNQYISLVMSVDDTSNDTQVWMFNALGTDPGGTYHPNIDPPSETPSTQALLSGTSPRSRVDAEPVTLWDTSTFPATGTTFIYYQEVVKTFPAVFPNWNIFFRASTPV